MLLTPNQDSINPVVKKNNSYIGLLFTNLLWQNYFWLGCDYNTIMLILGSKILSWLKYISNRKQLKAIKANCLNQERILKQVYKND